MKTDIATISNDDIKSKIHTIRGMQVMLDSDLAEVYGYTTKAFNQQVKNNIEKFDEDFMFQLTRDEYDFILRSKNLTIEQGKFSKYCPNCFTESGIYMLMTVLKGELATMQSKALIRAFRQMKDYIIEHQSLIGVNRLIDFQKIIDEHSYQIKEIKDNMVTKDELAVVIRDFTNPNLRKDYIILNGEAVEADIAYSEIYSSVKKRVYIVDDYISLKTLQRLKSLKDNVEVIIFSDNISKDKLTKSEFNDFQKEYPNISISFKRTDNKIHDRFIIMDFATDDFIFVAHQAKIVETN